MRNHDLEGGHVTAGGAISDHRGAKIIVCLEHRFVAHGGKTYTKLAFDYKYWVRYLSVFNDVRVVARVSDVPDGEALSNVAEVDGASVQCVAMPYYVGPRSFVRNLPSSLARAWKISGQNGVFLLRSGNVANLIWLCLMIRRKPYLREYPGSIKHGILSYVGARSLIVGAIATLSDWLARRQASSAVACSYVSEAIRSQYPSGSSREYVFSSVRLADEVEPKSDFSLDSIVRIVSVGRLEKEKGHHDLVGALTIVKSRSSRKIEMHLVGDGTQTGNLKDACERLGIDAVFHGPVLDRRQLFSIVRDADIFVLPSLTEGMPRALIEAMSIKVPCLASAVGGIPELAAPSALFDPADPRGMARKIDDLLQDEAAREKNANDHYDFVVERYGIERQTKMMHEFWRCAL